MLCDAFGQTVSRTGTNPLPFGFEAGAGYQSDADSGLTLVGNRYYDGAVGRFLQPDPSGQEDNEYAYAENNPVSNDDPDGLQGTVRQHPKQVGNGAPHKKKKKGKGKGQPNASPGKYKTAEEATKNAIRNTNRRSIKENREFAGCIYRRSDGIYEYMAPSRGTVDRSYFNSVPYDTTLVGLYHTHGANDPRYDSEFYSDIDKDTSDADNVPSYMGAPSGRIYKYTPIPGHPRQGTVKQIGEGGL